MSDYPVQNNPEEDYELLRVKNYLLGINDFSTKVGKAIRHAIDEVIAGRYTGRFSIDQIDKTEKTYIGTKVQHMTQFYLGIPYGEKLDTLIDAIEVDIKFTIGSNWTIPQEALNELCILMSAQDSKSQFQFGLLRTSDQYLNIGKNRDGKRTINKKGKENITWLIKDGKLPQNVLLAIDSDTIAKIYSYKSGQNRINELFRLCPGIVFNRASIESVAAQADSSKRVRDARKALSSEGISIFSVYDNEHLKSLGLPHLKRDEFMSYKAD